MIPEGKDNWLVATMFSSLSLVSAAFPIMCFQYAFAQDCGLELTAPTLKSDSTVLDWVTEGQQYFITTVLSNCTNVDRPLVVLIEARNSEGITEYLISQPATLMADNQLEVGVSWIPAQAKSYELRTFVVSDLEKPEILSRLMTTNIEVQGMSNDDGDPDVIGGNNQFALDFYSEVVTNDDGNIFYSPWSMSTAFALVHEGARGNTAQEIRSVYGLPTDDSSRRSSFAAIQDDLNDNQGNYTLRTANALWIKEGYKLSDEYVTIARDSYGSEVANVNFPSEESRIQINEWVEAKTNDKIKDLLPEGFLNELTRLVITNAIYFKGTWITQFDEENTVEEDFLVNADEKVKVPMMKLGEAYFKYAETDSLKIIELPYHGEKVSMLVLLPKNKTGLQALEESLTLDNLSIWRSNLYNQSVTVHIPKFKLETKYTLNEMLKEMGMPTAFSPDTADLSGINGMKGLFIQSALHKAFVEVNEEGTEAAAATAIGIGLTSERPQPPLFRADHPFIFIIQDSESGNILFMGRVTNPEA